jgi:hypothetical protein
MVAFIGPPILTQTSSNLVKYTYLIGEIVFPPLCIVFFLKEALTYSQHSIIHPFSIATVLQLKSKHNFCITQLDFNRLGVICKILTIFHNISLFN